MIKVWFFSVLAIPMILTGCGQAKNQNATNVHPTPTPPSSVQNHNLPSWLSISTADISSISIQGWGPGAAGNFVIYPASGTSTRLTKTMIDGLSRDEQITPYETAVSQGGGEWIDLKMKNGTSISFATFPNEPTPLQYIVTLNNTSGNQEKRTMILDDSGKVTSVFREINKGKLVRQKTK